MERLDLILIGASGFLGKHAAKTLASITKEKEYSDLLWGIAGRSMEKLQGLHTKLHEINVNTASIPMIECDIIGQENTLCDVTRQTKVMVNATGPNTLLSAPLVKACVQTGTHYVDISAELYHMLNVYRDFNKAAEEANVLIIPACGFAAIPVTAGLICLERQFKGTLHSVECYTELDIPLRANFPFPGHNNSLIHYGTWESLVYELKNYNSYTQLKKETFPDPVPTNQEIRKSFFHRHEGRFWYPYPGPEHDIVEQTRRYESKLGKTPYNFKIYTTMPLFIHFLILVPVFFIYYFLCKLACFRKLLRRFPRLFTAGLASHKGPNDKMKQDTKYSFTLKGTGWSDEEALKASRNNTLTVKVSGTDPGYQTTATTLVFSAITVLKERSKMPRGGVLTPGLAFKNTLIIDKLILNDIKFDIID